MITYSAFEGTNLMIDLEDQPELRTYCGRAHLVVMVTDLINDPSIDPIHENNDNGIPIDLICSGGAYTSLYLYKSAI